MLEGHAETRLRGAVASERQHRQDQQLREALVALEPQTEPELDPELELVAAATLAGGGVTASGKAVAPLAIMRASCGLRMSTLKLIIRF